jgi:glycine/D-amino acid oxidase-like deaminating enzyme
MAWKGMNLLACSWLSLCVWIAHTGELQAFQPSHSFFKTRRARSAFSKLEESSSSSQSNGADASSQLSQTNQASSMNIPSSPMAPAPNLSFRRKRIQHRDVVIIGGGLAGLSAAIYMSQIDPDRHVTILDREDPDESRKGTTVSSFAAAGMLAPQSERLPNGSLLDLSLASRRMYPDFCDMVETLAQEAGDEGAPYLWDSTTDGLGASSDLEPWNVGYLASGGFLAPAFAGDTVATWAPPEESGAATWLDANQVRELEPSLHPDVVGAWWFPEDASVDARRLTCSLRAACIAAGVQFLHGKDYEVTSLDLSDGTCKGVWLKSGTYMSAKSILVANGAWMRNLLPVPIEPHKGQSISLRMPKDRPPLLRRVLFAQDSYIVPKADGRIVVGATVEAGSYDSNVTPAGLLHILTHALQLVPGLKDLPVEETWVGLRPTTPDKGPIIGRTPWDNLFLAGGYWRNGVLLAPKTGHLLASLMSGQSLSKDDEGLLEAFAWDRFTSKEGSAKLVANSRYAASMHPIHKRTTGAGVSASVGTELGSYSSARSATDERKKDRDALFGVSSRDDAFEKAAAMGVSDASAFSGVLGEKKTAEKVKADKSSTPASSNYLSQLESYEGSADAYTVGAADPAPVVASKASAAAASGTDLDDAYQAIRANKAKQQAVLDDSDGEDERPDPGFRITHHNKETGEARVVPPYTSPGEFFSMIADEKKAASATTVTNGDAGHHADTASAKTTTTPTINGESGHYTEDTFDGYQTIQAANSRSSRDEELALMREARKANRVGMTDLD